MTELSKVNPNYGGDALGLEVVTIDQPDLSYEYNTLLFIRPRDHHGGIPLVWSASDSGCSCPTPFENFSDYTALAILQKMERVRDYEHARQIFDSWRTGYDKKPFLPWSALDALHLEEWFAV